MKCYCLYCKTGSESKLVDLLKNSMHNYLNVEAEIFYPLRVMNQKNRGIWRSVEQPLLPGYLFLYLDKEIPFPTFLISQERNAYKVLRYSDGTMALKDQDEKYALWVYRHKGSFEASTVLFKEGQMIKVIDGPLMEMDGQIVKIDRHHKRVVVEMMFAGALRRVNLSINIIEESNS
ncbi:MAG: transcription termination/antitermination NusG family protein [Sphaerochaetaceae bacterium]